MVWNLDVLRQKVKTAHGIHQLEKLEPCLMSVVERQEFAKFHFHQTEEAIGVYLDGNMKEGDLLCLFLSSETPDRQEFNTNRVKAKAHIHACLQNMHCVADTMSHVIYFSLALTSAPKESDISLKNVRNWVAAKSRYCALRNALDDLITNYDYKYLEAIVNHSKHRSIIETEIGIAFKPRAPTPTFEFRSFGHKEEKYGKRSVREFMKEEYLRQSRLVVAIGNEINSLV